MTPALMVLITAVLGWLIWRDALPLLARLVAVHERRHAAPRSAESTTMPDHLYAQANALGAEWARDDMLSAMREAYGECGDWTIVASRFADGGREVDHMRIAS